jgi:hypothetical protein
MKNTMINEDAAYEISRAALEDACTENGENLAQIQEIIADYTGHLPNEVADTDSAQALYEGTFQAVENLIQSRQKPAANEYGRRAENGQMIYWSE